MPICLLIILAYAAIGAVCYKFIFSKWDSSTTMDQIIFSSVWPATLLMFPIAWFVRVPLYYFYDWLKKFLPFL